MKPVPFYPNHEDDMHCMLAVYQSIFDYFYDEKPSWAQLEKLTGFSPGRAAWTVQILTYLAQRGMDIRMVEPFDYERYSREGQAYLEKIFTRAELDWNLNYTNILGIKPLIPVFVETVNHECRHAGLADIDSMLGEGRLVFSTLNSRSLNDKPGYTEHAVLIFREEGDHYIMHDPGLPPIPNRKVLKTKLLEAMGGEKNNREVTGFKLRRGVNQ